MRVVCARVGIGMCVRPCHSPPACQDWLLSGSQLIIKAKLRAGRQTGERKRGMRKRKETREPQSKRDLQRRRGRECVHKSVVLIVLRDFSLFYFFLLEPCNSCSPKLLFYSSLIPILSLLCKQTKSAHLYWHGASCYFCFCF